MISRPPFRLDVFSDQPALQVYTTGNIGKLNIPRKVIHGGPNLTYDAFSGIVLEQEGWVDAINTPEFNVDQICKLPFYLSSLILLCSCMRKCLDGPDRAYDWNATYVFSLV